MRDINLIPKEYLKRRTRPGKIVLGTVFTLLIISALVYFYIIPLNNIKALEQEISKYNEVVLDYNILKNKIEKLQENEAEISQRLEILKQISSGEIKPTRVFELVRSSLPKDVWLTNLSYTFTDVSVTAVSGSASGAAEFYVELSKKQEFKTVKLSPITVDENGYNFTVQISLNTGRDEKDENKAE